MSVSLGISLVLVSVHRASVRRLPAAPAAAPAAPPQGAGASAPAGAPMPPASAPVPPAAGDPKLVTQVERLMVAIGRDEPAMLELQWGRA